MFCDVTDPITGLPIRQVNISVPWRYGVDPGIWLMDPNSYPDPAILVIDLKDAKKKII